MARTREIDDPGRRLLVRALSLGLLGAGLQATEAAAQFFGSRPEKLPAGRSFYRLRGEVTVNGAPATMQTVVKPGDTVRTGSGGECIFVVSGHSMILRENSMIVIEATEEASSLLVRGLQMLSGALLSVSRDSRLAVRTANATIGIRGTGFYVEAEPQRTYFCTCYGVTDVASTSDPESRETIAASHHDRPVYVLSDAGRGRNIRNAPFINHTDQELALIEELVGRAPPFVFPKDTYGGPRREY